MHIPPPTPLVQPVAPQVMPTLAQVTEQQTVAEKHTVLWHWSEAPQGAPSAFFATHDPAPCPSQ
jgi:hypothetical protein